MLAQGRRRELFPADPGLTVRMVLAAVLTPATVLGALALLVLVAPLKLIVVVAGAGAIGIYGVVKERRAAVRGRQVSPAEAPQLHAAVERLCVLANVPKPRIVVEPEAQPNSWVVAVGRDRTSLHLTDGLLERLEPAELEAVIAHELAHVAHRDATVMTIVGGPGAVLLAGGRRIGFNWWFGFGSVAATAIGWLGSVGARVLSRYREFAADAGAVALTGNPAALASALMKVSDGLAALPDRDLRAVAARDAFHLLPVAREQPTRLPLPPTHPSLKARIARLQQLEAKLQAAR
jgi:heat shock protein HtpX